MSDRLRATLAGYADQLTATVGELVEPGRPWTLLDYPLHGNCGDAALFLGAEAVAQRLGSRITRVYDRDSFSADRARAGDSVLVVQAGGNWGGLYPTHHRHRLAVLEHTRGRPLVQLPQSVEFAGSEEREALRRAVGEHGAFTLLVRDQRSYERAVAEYDCEVRLVPDIAFALGSTPTTTRTDVPVVVHARTDKESPGTAATVAAGLGAPVVDWLEVDSRQARASFAAAKAANRVQRRFPNAAAETVSQTASTLLARSSLRRAASLLSAGPVAITDRLHGHILATLFEIPHVVVNDRFGKIAALRDAWTRDITGHEYAPTWAEAADALDRLRAA